VKFLCDRCKTRYSIGDDRVRGKILKIRCKNCANVITVREGMTDADAADAAPARRSKPTTMSPPIVTASPANSPGAAPAGALGAAFASAMTKPPPALEEEWYVSIDGDQSGPFSLAEAQRWISAKAYDADLHCWSEGFDDWLPVDKVSHFRGIRKKPAPPAAPPPLPRATGAQPVLRAQAPRGQAIEEEPKPLFAATMASLEKGAAAAAAAAAGMGMPSPGANGSARPSATPPAGQSRYPSPISGTPAIPSIQAKTNGTGPLPKLGSSTGPAAKLPSLPLPLPVANKSGPVPRLETRPAVNPFDVGDQAATQIEAPPFEGEAQTKAEPVASQAKRTASEANDVFARAAEPAKAAPIMAPAPRLANAPITPTTDSDDDDDDLSIGEVSRVVNLADLARSAKKPDKKPESQPSIAVAAAQRRTAAVAKLNATAPVLRVDDAGFAPNGIASDPSAIPGTEMAMQPAPPAESHKRGMIILLGVSALLLTGVIIAVVMLAGGEDTIEKGLGRNDKIDTTRPDDPLRPTKPGEVAVGSGSAINPFFPPKNPIKRPTNPNTNPNNQVVNGGSGRDPTELPTGDSLSPEDIDSVSKKYSTGTQRCYMRAQKGADAITIGNVKSIQATLTVAKDGSVTDVALASHSDDNLGKCLTNALRGWRFRTNPGGRVKFTLAFAAQ
jgi:predicted Zn finger-like uncharacterized protein